MDKFKLLISTSKTWICRSALILMFAGHALAQDVPAYNPVLDFRYKPEWWRSSLCFPDDSVKTLVEKGGELMYDYPGKFYTFTPKAKGFKTTVGIEVTPNARWVKQEFLSAKIPVMQTFLQDGDLEIVQEAFAAFAGALPQKDGRYDIILVHVKNTGKSLKTIAPVIRIKSEFPVKFDTLSQKITIKAQNLVSSTLKVLKTVEILPQKKLFQLSRLDVAPGATASFAITYRPSGGSVSAGKTLEEIKTARVAIQEYWEKLALPYGIIEVPDQKIQALLTSSVRNIWQAREIKDGLPAFQVGPAKYRGLWIVDGAFLLEAATMLGAGAEARNGVKYTLKQQKPNGAFEVLGEKHYKENGIVLWTCVRQAKLMNDKIWLRSIWPQMEKTVQFIRELRKRSSENTNWLCEGLIPPGMIDGGIWYGEPEKGEYSNIYWNLMGLKSAIEGAFWIGKTKQATAWQKEYDQFFAAFKKAAARDLRKDPNGNTYLPTIMGNINNHLPQRGQWAFCQAVYPGQLFKTGDPLVTGNLAMLEDTEQEGMVVGTGWLEEGIWNYFASFYAHAQLWQGNGKKAADLLYAMGNHAAPTLVWCEEQLPQDNPFVPYFDMPHNWASAEFIRLATHLLVLDRDVELHLFEGLPKSWTGPGMVTAINGLVTPFGKFSMELKVSADGSNAILKTAALPGNCKKIVVHRKNWAAQMQDGPIVLDPGKNNTINIKMP